MTRLIWDPIQDREYTRGVDQAVYYPKGGIAEVWNGMVSVSTHLEGVDQKRYFDGKLYEGRKVSDAFSATITAFANPEAMDIDTLVQRRHRVFDFSYRTETPNGYQIHLVYNAQVISTNYIYQVDFGEPMSWDIETRPVDIPNHNKASHLFINTWEAHPEAVALLEEILYGSDEATARMPAPSEIFDLFVDYALLVVTDHGDGTWTATGPDSAFEMLNATTFKITWPSAIYVDGNTYIIYSY